MRSRTRDPGVRRDFAVSSRKEVPPRLTARLDYAPRSLFNNLTRRSCSLLVRLDRLPFDLIIRSSTCLRSDGASRSQYPRPTVESHITAAQTFVHGTRLDAFRTCQTQTGTPSSLPYRGNCERPFRPSEALLLVAFREAPKGF
jgi:hypothetical protein